MKNIYKIDVGLMSKSDAEKHILQFVNKVPESRFIKFMRMFEYVAC